MLSIILALLAVVFITAELYFGPVYTMYDECPCGQTRAWLEFNECSDLRGVQFFLRIENPGDLHHQHVFSDSVYEGQYSIMGYLGLGFAMLSTASWFYTRKRI
jgi:hypothetical protein